MPPRIPDDKRAAILTDNPDCEVIVAGGVVRQRDRGIIETELQMADLATMEKAVARTEKEAKSGSADTKKQAEAAGLQVVDSFAFGPDYAETLRRWRASFMASLSEVKMLQFDDRFVRLWEFYLAYCEAAFDEANIDVIQFTLLKPD